MRKYILLGSLIILVALAVFVISQVLFRNNNDAINVEYRTDREPIEGRFPNAPEFIDCYWKADIIGETNFGPTNYWMKGFLVLDSGAFQQILEDNEWVNVTVDFPDGINPDITGKADFTWHSSREFEKNILRQNFVGTIFLDTTGGGCLF
jgi:hypothetical protein